MDNRDRDEFRHDPDDINPLELAVVAAITIVWFLVIGFLAAVRGGL